MRDVRRDFLEGIGIGAVAATRSRAVSLPALVLVRRRGAAAAEDAPRSRRPEIGSLM